MEDFIIPAMTTNECGYERRAGFQFEVGYVSIEEVAKALHEKFDGTIKKTSPFEFHIEEIEIGDLKIERDTQLLTSLKYIDWQKPASKHHRVLFGRTPCPQFVTEKAYCVRRWD